MKLPLGFRLRNWWKRTQCKFRPHSPSLFVLHYGTGGQAVVEHCERCGVKTHELSGVES